MTAVNRVGLKPAGASQSSLSVPVTHLIQSLSSYMTKAMNPYVGLDVVQILKRILEKAIDIEAGITAYLSDVPLPADIREQLDRIDEGIRAISTSSPEEMQRQIDAVNLAFGELCATIEQQSRRVIKQLPAPLEVLYKDPTFKLFDNVAFNKIERLIQNGDSSDSIEKAIEDECARMQLGREVLEEINSPLPGSILDALDDPEDLDLYTLVSMIKESQPQKQRDSLRELWDKDVSFFKGKTLYINMAEASVHCSGPIVECTRKDGRLAFRLHDQTRVHVSKALNVEISRPNKHPVCRVYADLGQPGKGMIDFITKDQCFQAGKYAVTYKVLDESSVKNFTRKFGNFFLHKRERPMRTIRIELQSDVKRHEITLFESEIAEGVFQRNRVFLDDTEVTFPTIDGIEAVTWTRERVDIPPEAAHRAARVVDTYDEKAIKLDALDKIDTESKRIRDDLVANYPALLDRLIEIYIKNKLQFPEGTLRISDPVERELLEDLRKLVMIYSDTLEMTRAPEKILEEIVVAANRQRVIEKSNDIEVTGTMRLLKGAVDSIRPALEKDAIFFMGNTGAGKSTTVGFLLGAKLEKGANEAGDPVFRYKGGQDLALYPKIGQSIGESETLYASGFPTPVEHEAAVDCPGFGDTRGEDHELCTNMSIDRAVQGVRSIRAVVVLIPAGSFLVDRANPALDAINNVRDKFPFAFRSAHSVHATQERIFMIITKGSHIPKGALEKIRDGTRFNLLLAEVAEAARKVTTALGETSQQSNLQAENLRKRQEVWTAVLQMHERGQVAIADLRNRASRGKLIKKYFGDMSTVIPKREYQSAMEGGALQARFGKCVEMSAHTWEKQIISKFLNINYEIDSLRANIKDAERQITEEQSAINGVNASLEALSQLGEQVSQLLQRPTSQLEAGSLPEEVREKLEQIRAQKSAIADGQQQFLEAKKTRVALDLEDKKMQLESAEKVKRKTVDKINELIRRINTLSSGVHKDILYKSHIPKDHIFKFRFWKSAEHRKEAQKRGDSGRDDDFDPGKQETVAAKDYTGKTAQVVPVEREYRILPSDPKMRAQWEKAFERGGVNAKIGKYAATLRGEHFTCDLGAIAQPTGRKVTYGFEMDWKKGRKFPWLEIVHTMPNADYNEAEIKNAEAEKNIAEKEKANLEVSIPGLQKEVRGFEEELASTEKKLSARAAEVFSSNIVDALKKTKEQVVTQVKDAKASIKASNEKIAKLKDKLVALTRSIAEKQKFQRELGLVVQRDWETSKLLLDFAQMVIEGVKATPTGTGGATAKATYKQSTIEACRSFITAYRENGESVFVQSGQLLGLI